MLEPRAFGLLFLLVSHASKRFRLAVSPQSRRVSWQSRLFICSLILACSYFTLFIVVFLLETFRCYRLYLDVSVIMKRKTQRTQCRCGKFDCSRKLFRSAPISPFHIIWSRFPVEHASACYWHQYTSQYTNQYRSILMETYATNFKGNWRYCKPKLVAAA